MVFKQQLSFKKAETNIYRSRGKNTLNEVSAVEKTRKTTPIRSTLSLAFAQASRHRTLGVQLCQLMVHRKDQLSSHYVGSWLHDDAYIVRTLPHGARSICATVG